MLKTPTSRERLEIFPPPPYVVGMITMISAFVSLLSFRFRSRAGRELELVDLAADLKRNGVGEGSNRHPVASQGLLADRSLTLEDVAKSEGVVPSYATRLFRRTIVAPDIVSAILRAIAV